MQCPSEKCDNGLRRSRSGAIGFEDERDEFVLTGLFNFFLELADLDVLLVLFCSVRVCRCGLFAILLLLRLSHSDVDDNGLAGLINHDITWTRRGPVYRDLSGHREIASLGDEFNHIA